MIVFSQYLRDVSVPCPSYDKEKGFHVNRSEVFKLFPVKTNNWRMKTMDQWFSTGVPRYPWVPWKALGVPPICKLDVFLLEKYIYGCRQIVLFPREGAANQKRSRTTAIEINIVNEWKFQKLGITLIIRDQSYETLIYALTYMFVRFLKEI